MLITHIYIYLYIIENPLFSDVESNVSRSLSTHKPKRKKAPVLSNPSFEHLHFVNKNFQPDFHGDGNSNNSYIPMSILWHCFIISGSYPSPIPQYNPQLRVDKHITSNDAVHNVTKQYVHEGNLILNNFKYVMQTHFTIFTLSLYYFLIFTICLLFINVV